MPSRYMQLPYDQAVGIVLINRKGLVWAGQRPPECARFDTAGSWHMPQGRIEPCEPAREAALRILERATGIRSVEVIAEAPGWFTYELPSELVGVALKGKYCGQKVRWIALRFLGDDSEIDIAPREGARAHFEGWKWVSARKVARMTAPLKRELYEDVVAAFAPFLPQPMVQWAARNHSVTAGSGLALVRYAFRVGAPAFRAYIARPELRRRTAAYTKPWFDPRNKSEGRLSSPRGWSWLFGLKCEPERS